MKEVKTEKLSLFVDGELEAREADALLSSMCREGDLKSCWQRYHLIGDALRNNLPRDTKHNLAKRVATALSNEPTLLCPPSSNSAPLSSPFHKRQKTVTGFAIAASVAVVGFVAVSLLGWDITHETQRVASQQNESSTSALTTSLVPVNQQQDVELVSTNQVNPKLRSYIIDHTYSTSSYSRPGLPPNVRVVTFSADQ